MATIRAIYRYPVKGLSPEPLAGVALAPHETIPGDRLYAIENGPSGFDAEKQRYLPKQKFLMLMRNERLAALRTAYDPESRILTIDSSVPPRGGGLGRGSGGEVTASTDAHDLATHTATPPHESLRPGARQRDPGGDGNEVSGDLSTAAGRATIERFFAAYCAGELRGPPRILHADGHNFSDLARKVVSIINLASVAAIADMVGAPVNPLRFRGNLYVDGLTPWSELDLVDKCLTVSPRAPPAGDSSFISPPPLAEDGQRRSQRTKTACVRLKVVKRIVRCAATNVDPETAMRDLNIPQTLMRHLGHADCGIYAEVIEGGDIAVGDDIEIV